MYLTRLTLDPRSAQARRDLADAYEMHRTLARAFVADEHSVPPRFLWRLEAASNTWTKPVVLVQSMQLGNWSALQALPGYLQGEAESKPLDVQALVREGERYRFRLLANPTVTRQGKRYGLTGEEPQLAWLSRQGERHGFALEAVLVTASDLLLSRKGDSRISLQRACFEGRLQVNEWVTFRRALEHGIGPGKAFGCGLLSLARS